MPLKTDTSTSLDSSSIGALVRWTLLDRGSRSLDALNDEWDTPLHLCVAHLTRANPDDRGAPSGVIHLLLERGSQARDMCNCHGQTPFDIAESLGNSEVIHALVRWRGRTMLRCMGEDVTEATSRYRRRFWRGVVEFAAGAKK